MKSKSYTISDGKLVLVLRPADGGWYAVSCPLEPELLTQARSIEEAFKNAYDARKALIASRRQMIARRARG